MPVITVQELIDASTDATTVEHFANGAPAIVTPRYGAPFPNMPKLVFDFTAAFSQSQYDKQVVFEASQVDKESRFQTFLLQSGYQDLGDYAAGVTITAYNQVFRYSGELYGLSAAVDLPYVTTGVWATENVKFVSRGDAVLRQQMADPNYGSNLSAWKDPVAPSFLKTVSDMKAGDPVSLFRIIQKVNWGDLVNNAYDAATAINGADDLFQTGAVKGGVMTIPKGNIKIGSDLHLRGGFTMRGEGRDVSTLVIADTATIRLTGLGNTLERMCFHKDTPRENYITAGHKTDVSLTAVLSEVGFCKFTATQLAEFVNYALIGNYRSQGITVHNNRMFTYHLAFITKYLTSDWVRLYNNYAKALQSANVTNSELFKIEAVNKAWITYNDLVIDGVPNALSCLTLESGSSNVHVDNNVLRADTGYAIRVEHSDNTITPPTDCTLTSNTLIASGSALALYSGNANVTGLALEGGEITGPVTIYGKKTRLNNIQVRAGFTDPRTGITLRGDDIKGRNVEVVGFGVALANAAVSAIPDNNFDIRGFKASGQANESVALKYLAGKCFLSVESIDNTSASGAAAVSLFASGAAAPADTLTIEPGAIIAPNIPALKVNFMNGVTVGDCSKIRSPTRYSIVTSDTSFTFESTFIAANMNSVTHRVNTVGKYAGRVVYNTGPKKPYYATGPLPSDVWVDSAGTVTYTPV